VRQRARSTTAEQLARVAQLRAARKAAQDRLGGRMGRLRQEFRSRRATDADVLNVAADHLAVMDAGAALLELSGRRACPHGRTEGSECYGCIVGETAEQTAVGRARRDVMSLGGFGPLGSDLDPARWRTAPVDPVRPYMQRIGAR
jgi:hypothetical protein